MVPVSFTFCSAPVPNSIFEVSARIAETGLGATCTGTRIASVPSSLNTTRPDALATYWRSPSAVVSTLSPTTLRELWCFSSAGSLVFSSFAGSMVTVTVTFFFSPAPTLTVDGREKLTPGMSVLATYSGV